MRTGTRSAIGQFLSPLPLGAALSCLAVTFAVAQIAGMREIAQARAGAAAEARHVSAQLSVGIAGAFDALQRIGAWWLLQGRPEAPEDWEADMALFLKPGAGLEKIAWINAGGRGWEAPAGGAPRLGVLDTSEPNLQSALSESRRRRATAVSAVFESEDKAMVYACVPIRKAGRIAGTVCGLYDAGQLVRSVLRPQAPDQYAVTLTTDRPSVRIAGQPNAAAEQVFARGARVAVANATWLVTVTPLADSGSTLQRSILIFGGMATALLYICAVIARISRLRAAALAAANAQLESENQERRRAESRIAELNRDLERRLQEFHTLLDVLPVGIAVAEDAECRRVWTNRALATMLGVREGDNVSAASGQAEHRMLRNGEPVPAEELPMQTAARTGKPVANFYVDIERSDGSVLHTLSYAAPLFDESGKVRGVIDACVDITDRKALEDRLQRAEKYESLALMAGGIAHDFNNLLTVIIGNASVIASETPERTRVGRALGDLQASANVAAELVGRLLAFTGRVWRQVVNIDLSRAIAEMTAFIRRLAPAHVAIEYDLARGLPPIAAGEAELRTVVESLVANAVEAMESGAAGKIEIRTSNCDLLESDIEVFYPDRSLRPGRHVRLEVTDNGAGIPDEILPRVFDPFFTTKFVGRGLGLSAVHGIVRAHGGAIRITSAAPHGTRVEMVFPAHDPSPPGRATGRPAMKDLK